MNERIKPPTIIGYSPARFVFGKKILIDRCPNTELKKMIIRPEIHKGFFILSLLYNYTTSTYKICK